MAKPRTPIRKIRNETVLRVIRQAGRNVDTAVNEFIADFTAELIRATPVDTGFLRASWYMASSLAEPARSISATHSEKDPTLPKGQVPPATAARLSLEQFAAVKRATTATPGFERQGTSVSVGGARGEVATITGGVETVFILNGARYARFVEFGTSKMAPRAFVRSTVAKATQIADRTIARIRPA